MKENHHVLIIAGLAVLAYVEWRRARGYRNVLGQVASMPGVQAVIPSWLATRGFQYPSGRPSGIWGIPAATCVPPSGN